MTRHAVIFKDPVSGKVKVNTGLELVFDDRVSRPLLLKRGQTFPRQGRMPDGMRKHYLWGKGKPVPRGTIW